MQINIVTLFPEFFEKSLETSILGRAQKKDLLEVKILFLRQFTNDKHQTTDMRPFGGGPGMVMMIEPIDRALKSLGVAKGQEKRKILLTSAKGEIFTQQKAQVFSQLEMITIICGHYEAVDERVAEHLVDAELRIGDYVLSGGEAAALVITDAVTRLLPGVLGNELSNQDESHSVPGRFAFPQYTQPVDYQGWQVPEVLRGGNHQLIAAWREAQRAEAKQNKG